MMVKHTIRLKLGGGRRKAKRAGPKKASTPPNIGALVAAHVMGGSGVVPVSAGKSSTYNPGPSTLLKLFGATPAKKARRRRVKKAAAAPKRVHAAPHNYSSLRSRVFAGQARPNSAASPLWNQAVGSLMRRVKAMPVRRRRVKKAAAPKRVRATPHVWGLGGRAKAAAPARQDPSSRLPRYENRNPLVAAGLFVPRMFTPLEERRRRVRKPREVSDRTLALKQLRGLFKTPPQKRRRRVRKPSPVKVGLAKRPSVQGYQVGTTITLADGKRYVLRRDIKRTKAGKERVVRHWVRVSTSHNAPSHRSFVSAFIKRRQLRLRANAARRRGNRLGSQASARRSYVGDLLRRKASNERRKAKSKSKSKSRSKHSTKRLGAGSATRRPAHVEAFLRRRAAAGL